MKGWLDKYNDGGPVQENYNDYSVSAPEGYVGDGTFNEGRDYSPAWGGQFKEGGELPNVTVKGKKKQPIYVTNPNDPRLKAYNDSLALYKQGEKKYKERLEFNKKNNIPKSSIRKWNDPVEYHIVNKKGDIQLNKIQPIEGNGYWYNFDPDNVTGTNVPSSLTDNYGFRYKKPTQLIEYINRVKQTETPELEDLQGGLPVDISLPELHRQAGPNRITMGKPLFKGGPQTDYYTPIDEAGNVVQSNDFKTNQFQMGGSLPGAVGFTYARTQSPAPSNGKYAKKTMASAQNGMEMRYYQNGLDFEPKGMGKNGKVIKDDMGQWAHPGEITEIGSNQITMQGVPYPVLGISDTGDTQMMYPDQEYEYDGESVTEYPMMQNGGNILDAIKAVGNYMINKPDSNAENISEVFDPSGISSWDDVIRSYNKTGMSGETALEAFGAIPMLGKAKKAGKFLDIVSKAVPKTGRQARNVKASVAALKGIGKYGPNTGRATDAYQAYDQYEQGGQLTKLDQLTNFTNYNTKQPGGWLDKYQ